MREMFEDPNMKYPSDLEEEIKGVPTWFSTCDNNLLVYTVMTSSIKAQSFTYLKEIMQAIQRNYPELDSEYESIASLQKCAPAVQQMLDQDNNVKDNEYNSGGNQSFGVQDGHAGRSKMQLAQ